MKVNLMTITTGAIMSYGIISLLTAQIHWGVLGGILVMVGGAKWIRLAKQKENDEIEYDETFKE